MAIKEFDLDGGDSVYCINQAQLAKALEIAEADDESSRKITEIMETIATTCTRNEQAALSFLLIHRLLGAVSHSA